MKRQFLIIAFAASVSFAACGGSDEGSTADSTTTVNTTTSTNSTDEAGSTNSSASASSENKFDESASYVDLKTNKSVKLKRNQGSEELYDAETNQPYSYFFYNPATRDTFDRSGHIVNSYLRRGNNGDYTLDEEKWKTKVDSDGDVKMKDGDESKIKYDASSGKVKVKTADTTIKY